MDKIIITIAIPFYNDKEFLSFAIESVIHQTYSNWLLYLLDDGSTDGSLQIANEYAKGDDRIRCISDGTNRGLIYRLNQSVSSCSTKYYARMDADDIMHPNRLKTQIEILEKYPNIDVLGTNAYTIDQYNKVKGARGIISDELCSVSYFIHPSITGRTEWFVEHPYNPVALRFEDAELWYRAKSDSQFRMLNAPLLFYREFGGGYYKKYRKTIIPMFKVCRENLFKNEYRLAIHWLFQGCSMIAKFLIYLLFYYIGKEDYLIDRRSVNISSDEAAYAQTVIEKM